jgi:DNA-binding NarL/FixJ family response regulator
VYAALRAGASGFLLKDTPHAELLAAIRIVAGATPCWPRASPAS